RLAFRHHPGAGWRSRRQAVLAGIIRQLFQSGIDVLAELVVHLLQRDDFQLRGGIDRAVTRLAAEDADADAAAIDHVVAGAQDDVARRQSAALTSGHCYIQVRRDDENALLGIESRRRYVAAGVSRGISAALYGWGLVVASRWLVIAAGGLTLPGSGAFGL